LVHKTIVLPRHFSWKYM